VFAITLIYFNKYTKDIQEIVIENNDLDVKADSIVNFDNLLPKPNKKMIKKKSDNTIDLKNTFTDNNSILSPSKESNINNITTKSLLYDSSPLAISLIDEKAQSTKLISITEEDEEFSDNIPVFETLNEKVISMLVNLSKYESACKK